MAEGRSLLPIAPCCHHFIPLVLIVLRFNLRNVFFWAAFDLRFFNWTAQISTCLFSCDSSEWFFGFKQPKFFRREQLAFWFYLLKFDCAFWFSILRFEIQFARLAFQLSRFAIRLRVWLIISISTTHSVNLYLRWDSGVEAGRKNLRGSPQPRFRPMRVPGNQTVIKFSSGSCSKRPAQICPG